MGLDFITELGYGNDRRLRPALKILRDKRQTNGTWLLDKVHPDLDTGANEDLVRRMKKLRPFALEEPGKPSKWITLTALRVLKRVEES